MPQTPLYAHTQDPESKSSFAEAYKVIQERWAGKKNPSGDAAEDEKTLETAASTLVYAALSPDLDGTYINLFVTERWGFFFLSFFRCAKFFWLKHAVDKSGTFLRNCEPFTLAPYATDPKNAEKLWKLSEELVGEKFDI